MRISSRLAIIAAVAAALAPLVALPAMAKGAPGEDPQVVTVLVFGANQSGPIVFEGAAAMDFARSSGMLAAAQWTPTTGTVLSPVLSGLGPRFTATYVFRPDVGTEGKSVIQDLYPYAKGGPWAFTPPGQRLYAAGWWQVTPSLVQTLRAAGLPAALAAQRGSTSSLPTSDGHPWGLWIALAIVAMIPILDTALSRRRSAAVPTL